MSLLLLLFVDSIDICHILILNKTEILFNYESVKLFRVKNMAD